jgi:hypothetical protein
MPNNRTSGGTSPEEQLRQQQFEERRRRLEHLARQQQETAAQSTTLGHWDISAAQQQAAQQQAAQYRYDTSQELQRAQMLAQPSTGFFVSDGTGLNSFTVPDNVYQRLSEQLRTYGMFDTTVQTSTKIKKRFNKKNPLKFEIINETIAKEFINRLDRIKQIKFYQNILKNDKTLTPNQSDEIKFLIQQNRIALRYTNDKPKKTLKISYKGITQLINQGPNGFFLKHDFKKAISNIISEIRKKRAQQKQKATKHRNIQGVNVFTQGGTHQESGSILNLYRQIGFRRVNSLRLPESIDKHVGIEIEFFTSYHRDHISEMLVDAKLTKNCRIMSDASIQCTPERPYSYELCVLAKEDNFSEIIERVCDLLSDIKAQVNQSCGLHVHLDMRTRDVNIVFNNMVACQDFLYTMVAPHRRTNRYCIPQPSKNIRTADMSHYSAISASSYNKYKTLEIRMHEGTISAFSINNWVKLLTRIASYGKVIEKDILTDVEVYRLVGEVS